MVPQAAAWFPHRKAWSDNTDVNDSHANPTSAYIGRTGAAVESGPAFGEDLLTVHPLNQEQAMNMKLTRKLENLRDKRAFRHTGAFAAGTLIGAAIWTPVFAASADQAQDWKAVGIVIALVLLILGLALKTWVSKSVPRYRAPRSFDTRLGAPHGEVVNTGGDD